MDGTHKSILAISLLVAAVFLIGCVQQSFSTIRDDAPAGAKIVEITAEGFNPKVITVNKGETVAFVNKDSASHWPASARHPTHTIYPGSDAAKCGTPKQAKIFDACEAVSTGKVFAFAFNEAGNWAYHDHLNCCTNPKFFGNVTVQ